MPSGSCSFSSRRAYQQPHLHPHCSPLLQPHPPRSDALLGEVQREADNGRLLRLLFKLNYICERPELGGDTQWAETGDRWGRWRVGRRACSRTSWLDTHGLAESGLDGL